MKIKDIIALALLGLITFPIILLGVLLWTGNVRLEFGPDQQPAAAIREQLLDRVGDSLAHDAHQEAVAGDSGQGHSASGAGMDEALSAREGELDRREADMQRESMRLEDLKLENTRLMDAILKERERLEALLGSKDSLEKARMLVLARTFVGMKADQAAKIFMALDDILVTGILRHVSDDKARAKILAALGKLDPQRAAKVSRLLEKPPAHTPATSAKPAETKEHAKEGGK